MEDSIFTKIIKGDIPCHKVFEDDTTFVFMDIHPIQPGQVLVVPKRQIASLWELEAVDFQAVMRTCQLVARRLAEVFPDKARVAMQLEGLEVDHAHVKLFPFDTSAEFHTIPDPHAEPDHAALSVLASRLAF